MIIVYNETAFVSVLTIQNDILTPAKVFIYHFAKLQQLPENCVSVSTICRRMSTARLKTGIVHWSFYRWQYVISSKTRADVSPGVLACNSMEKSSGHWWRCVCGLMDGFVYSGCAETNCRRWNELIDKKVAQKWKFFILCQFLPDWRVLVQDSFSMMLLLLEESNSSSETWNLLWLVNGIRFHTSVFTDWFVLHVQGMKPSLQPVEWQKMVIIFLLKCVMSLVVFNWNMYQLNIFSRYWKYRKTLFNID